MKLRLVVASTTSPAFARANVSIGPPRQAAQEGGATSTQPASAKISTRALPSTCVVRSCRAISEVAGTRQVSTATRLPRSTRAAMTKSASLPPVQDPM